MAETFVYDQDDFETLRFVFMLTQEVIDRTVNRICLMPFFPSSDEGARGTITKEIADMATSDEQVTWLGYRFIQLFPKQWPGIAELRAVFCKRFKPADGFQMNSAVYEDFPTEAQLGPVPGLALEPSPTEREAIEAASIPAGRQLEAGEVSADPELATLVHDIAVKATMPTVERRSVQEISQMLYGRYGKVHAATGNSTNPSPKTTAPGSESATPTIGSAKRITQADINAELRAAGRPTSAEERPRNIAGLGVGE